MCGDVNTLRAEYYTGLRSPELPDLGVSTSTRLTEGSEEGAPGEWTGSKIPYAYHIQNDTSDCPSGDSLADTGRYSDQRISVNTR